jgi:hypothetical protein
MKYKLTNEDVDFVYRLFKESDMPLYFIVHAVFGIGYLDFKNQALRLKKEKIRNATQ